MNNNKKTLNFLPPLNQNSTSKPNQRNSSQSKLRQDNQQKNTRSNSQTRNSPRNSQNTTITNQTQNQQSNQISIKKQSTLKQTQNNKNKLGGVPPKFTRKKYHINYLKMVSDYILRHILEYACGNIQEAQRISLITKKIYLIVSTDKSIWIRILTKSYKNIEQLKQKFNINDLNQLDAKIIRNYLRDTMVIIKQKSELDFLQYYQELFRYGSSKENIPNKFIKKVMTNSQLTLEINKMIRTIKPRYNFDNYMSYISFKSELVNLFRFSETDKYDIQLTYYSQGKGILNNQKFQFSKPEVLDKCIKTRVFNFLLRRNFLFVYFEGDTNLLYMMYTVSAIELLFKIKKQKYNTIQNNPKKIALRNIIEFEDYIKNQLDFEIIISLNNGKNHVLRYINTKVYPVQINKDSATFIINLEGEIFDFSECYLLLDNKLGIKEKIKNLLLGDLILKDLEDFLIIHSGFCWISLDKESKNQAANPYQYSDDDYTFYTIELNSTCEYHCQLYLIVQNHSQTASLSKIVLTVYSDIF